MIYRFKIFRLKDETDTTILMQTFDGPGPVSLYAQYLHFLSCSHKIKYTQTQRTQHSRHALCVLECELLICGMTLHWHWRRCGGHILMNNVRLGNESSGLELGVRCGRGRAGASAVTGAGESITREIRSRAAAWRDTADTAECGCWNRPGGIIL